ncbi:N2227-like protein-domain-containing protein [Coniochaeta sp. 2T2.1]|nr:N2227-like protein-domain-containing protein [Coniochaeta sp. 2T2.1]
MEGHSHDAGPEAAEESMWKMDDQAKDVEEQRVIFGALDSFLQYAKVSFFNVTHMRRQNFYALPQAHWMMLAGPPFNYLETLDQVDGCIRSNARLGEAIVKYGLMSFGDGVADVGANGELTLPPHWAGCSKHADVDKARSTIRQFYRDWSAEGAKEREACYGPVKRALAQEKERRLKEGITEKLNVLVPGAGLARLMYDLAVEGSNVEGNEISYHQLLASSYILNFCEKANSHTIYPWIHTFSNHKTRSNHLRGYTVPDVHCATEFANAADPGEMNMTAADFLCGYEKPDKREAFDAVTSVFFLDTAPNLIRYLQVLYHCLKPGGVLINVGPLLWHFENNPPGHHSHDDDDDDEGGTTADESNGIADPGSFELSDDEVMALLVRIGFEVESRETGIEAPYIQDPDSMLQTVYRASSWVARRPVNENEHRA